MRSLPDLLEERSYACRLTPDRALQTLDEAEAFLRERGMMTLTPDCSLPSLFGACHEEPYDPAKKGFAQWPKTKWRWGGELEERPGVQYLKLHRGKGLYLSDETLALADPLCRAELERAEAEEHGPEATRLVAHLAEAGPALVQDLKAELELETRAFRALRQRLERVGAIVSRGLVLEPHHHTSELLRWDQLFPEPAQGGLEQLLVAGVRSAVVAPEREVRTWFSWPVPSELIENLVAAGRLARPEPGWLCAP